MTWQSAPLPAPRLRATAAFALVSAVTTLAAVVAWAGAESVALVSGAGLTVMVLAPALAWLHLARLSVSFPSELTASAGATRLLELQIQNDGLFAARDLLVTVVEGRRASVPPTANLPALAAGRRARVRTSPRFPERGRFDHVRVALETSFPFGLFVGRSLVELPVDLLVLPRLGRLSPLEARLTAGGATDDAPRGRRGQGEFYALREWRAGEHLRGIAWKLSARRGRLLTRELTREDRPEVELVLSTWTLTPPTHPRRLVSFERAVSLTATLAEHVLRRGQRVTLILAGPETRRFAPARGRADLLPLLAALAEVDCQEGDPFRALASADPRGSAIVVLAGGGREVERRVGGAAVLDVDAESGPQAFDVASRGVYDGSRAPEPGARTVPGGVA